MSKKEKIKAYKLKDGTTKYMFQLYLGVDPLTGREKRTTRRGFSTRKEANLAIARLKLEFEEGPIKVVQNMRFKEVYESWIEIYKTTVKPTTYKAQLIVLNKHVLPYFEDMFVNKITPVICQKYINQQHKKLIKYHNSVNLAYRILEHAFTMKLIDENPMSRTTRPKRRKSKKRDNEYWTKEELLHFFDCLDSVIGSGNYNHNLKIVYRLLAYTGMRKAELLALRWSDIDFDKKLLTISRTTGVTVDGYGIQDSTKTDSSTRTISLDRETLAIIRNYEPKLKRWLLVNGNSHHGDEQLLIPNEENEPYHLDYPNHFLNKLIKQFDLKKIHIHGFRHTHCSILFEAGASVAEVQDRLGHSDFKTTMNIYNHVSEKMRDETADKFIQFMKLS